MGFDRKRISFITIFVLELILCFVIFPSWFFLPVSRLVHYVILFVIILMICTFAILLIFINKKFPVELISEDRTVNEFNKLSIKIKSKNIEKIILFIGFLLYNIFLIIIKFPALSSEYGPGGDEGYHVFRVLLVKKMVSFGGILPNWILAVAFYLFVAIIIVSVILIKKKQKLREKIRQFILKKWKIKLCFLIGLTLIILVGYAILFDFMSYKAGFQLPEGNINIAFARYTPINPMLGLIPLITFGYSEFWLNLVPLFFSTFSMIYLYKLIKRYRTELFAIFVSLLVPLIPTIFEYESQYYLATGVLFFSIACMYHFHKAIEKPDIIEMNKFLFIYLTGFLYKKVILFTLFSLYIYLLFIFIHRYWKNKQINWKEVQLWFGYLVLALIPSITWILISNPVVWRKYILSFSQLFSEYIIAYAKLMPQIISFIWILAIIGIPLSLIFMRDHLTLTSLFFSVAIYLIYSADAGWHSATPRFIIPILPFILICSLQIIDFGLLKLIRIIIRKKPKIKVKLSHYLLILWFLITLSFIVPLTIEGIKSDKESLETRIPYDQTAKFLSENLTSDDSIVLLFGSNPFTFYSEKHEVTCTLIMIREILSEESIISYLAETNSSYLAIPYFEAVQNMITEDTYNSLFSSSDFSLYHTLTSENGNSISILVL